jgi:hypothetical protein
MSAQPVPAPDGAILAAGFARVRSRALPSPVAYLLTSLAVLLPCYWQPRIQAGDLSSHIYNAWLAGLIGSGRLDGLQIVHQATNVLFDLLLSVLLPGVGADWAQRISVSVAVMIFVWGAFAFVSAVSGRPAWHLLPCLAMLAYGWVFHVGFFNFYLSLGLCFWALAALWSPRPARVAAACALFGLAYTAHALPVLWAVALVVYLWIAQTIPGRARAALLGVALAALVAAHFAITRRMTSNWGMKQLMAATGADQALVFNHKYGLLMAALLFVWATYLLALVRAEGASAAAQSIPLHWCVLTAAGIFILPSTVLIPGYRHALVYIADRMSLASAVCICALVARAPLRAVQRSMLLVVALGFFVYLFHDERSLNRFEDRVDQAVGQLPPGTRVVSPILDSGLSINVLAHMVDRACLGRCYSYSNYEPSTWAFRVRAVKSNPYVIDDYGASFDMQLGKYKFKPADLPLYALVLSDSGQVTPRTMNSGSPSGTTVWRGL